MGYRTYIAPLSKDEYIKIKDLTLEQLYEHKGLNLNDEMDYLGVYDITGKCLHELGKYTEFDDKKHYTKVFSLEETNIHFTDEHDFWIVEKEYLKLIINHYKEKIKKYYNDMVTPFFGDRFDSSEFLNTVKREYNDSEDNDTLSFDFTKITQAEIKAFWSTLEHVRSMRTEWTCLTPYDLDGKDSITTSWKYEYAIFELVRIYKTFDWEKDLMIYYGY